MIFNTGKKNSSETITLTLTASGLGLIVVIIVIILMYYPDIIYFGHFLFIDNK